MLLLTVDIESDWGGRVDSVSAVVELVPRLLDMLSASNSKATFFISTKHLSNYANTIRRVHECGHEIASHGHSHNIAYDELSPDALHVELKHSAILLEDLIGAPIMGFRTPQFRKHPLTEEVLTDLGYGYDSSSVSVALSGRYSSRQHEKGLLPEYPVSSIYGRFPAGVKWMNLLMAGLDSHATNVIYLHMFDLMTLSRLFNESVPSVPFLVKGFYAARIGSPFATVERLLERLGPSRTIISDLD